MRGKPPLSNLTNIAGFQTTPLMSIRTAEKANHTAPPDRPPLVLESVANAKCEPFPTFSLSLRMSLSDLSQVIDTVPLSVVSHFIPFRDFDLSRGAYIERADWPNHKTHCNLISANMEVAKQRDALAATWTMPSHRPETFPLNAIYPLLVSHSTCFHILYPDPCILRLPIARLDSYVSPSHVCLSP
jgi:hypothetical protein